MRWQGLLVAFAAITVLPLPASPAPGSVAHHYERRDSHVVEVVRDLPPPRRLSVSPARPLAASDDGVALQALINSTRNGGTVFLESGRVYSVDRTILVANRFALTIDGNGATIRSSTVGDGHRANFRLQNGSGIVLRELVIQGGYTRPGFLDKAIQWSHGVEILGTARATVANSTVGNVAGDCVYAGLGARRAKLVRVTNLTCNGTGRNGVSAVAANDVLVSGGSYLNVGHLPFDVEPNPGPAFGVNGAVFENAAVGNYAGPSALSVVGDNQADNVVFRNLTVTAARGAVAYVRTPIGRRRSGFTVSNVVARSPTHTPSAMVIQRVDRVRVANNAIPTRGGVLLVCTEVRNLTFFGNAPPTSSRCPAVTPPDLTPPNTRITSGPARRARARRASFRFRSTERGSTFQCRLDGLAWRRCRSPKTYTRMAPGSHTFRVRAHDAAGNVDPTPAVRRWRTARGHLGQSRIVPLKSGGGGI
jgi:hypothetical protein